MPGHLREGNLRGRAPGHLSMWGPKPCSFGHYWEGHCFGSEVSYLTRSAGPQGRGQASRLWVGAFTTFRNGEVTESHGTNTDENKTRESCPLGAHDPWLEDPLPNRKLQSSVDWGTSFYLLFILLYLLCGKIYINIKFTTLTIFVGFFGGEYTVHHVGS